jgi:HKD family nuclease
VGGSMNKQKIAELRAGLETGFINSGYNSSLAYQPQFLSNNHKEGKKVLSSIEDELMSCDKFQISVAFITMGGITPLLQTLKELEKNGIPGEILTTNYLNFSEPKALEKLHGLSNITLKMYDVEKAAEGFHTKGYIFKKEEIYRIIIGSSNMTSAALTSNREWNTKVYLQSRERWQSRLLRNTMSFGIRAILTFFQYFSQICDKANLHCIWL